MQARMAYPALSGPGAFDALQALATAAGHGGLAGHAFLHRCRARRSRAYRGHHPAQRP